MQGRWTIHVCKDCGQRAHYQDRCPKDKRRIWTEQVPVPVVPCNDAAIERVAVVLCDESDRFVWQTAHERVRECYRELAGQALRAAGETP
jgi:hypothetical protein